MTLFRNRRLVIGDSSYLF